MANYSFRDPGDDMPDGSVINSGNFSQLLPGTEILVGKTLTINGGNWVNVKRQPEWTVTGGNWTQINRCSHLSQQFVEHGLPVCTENCSHVVDVDYVYIDGILIDTVYNYKETVI